VSSLIYSQYYLLLILTAAFRFPLSNLLLKIMSSPRKSRSCLPVFILLLTFSSAYCDESTFDCLEIKIGVFWGIPAIYHPSSGLIRRIPLITLLCVFDRHPRKLFFLFLLVDIRMHWMPVLFFTDLFDRCHLAAVQPSQLFFMMLDLEIRGGGDDLVGNFF
jgi:hypothetical protein